MHFKQGAIRRRHALHAHSTQGGATGAATIAPMPLLESIAAWEYREPETPRRVTHTDRPGEGACTLTTQITLTTLTMWPAWH